MSRAVDTRTTRLAAECLVCAWRTTGTGGLGNAARHHDSTGHAVRVEVDRTITYGDPSAAPAGQEGMALEAAGYQERHQ